MSKYIIADIIDFNMHEQVSVRIVDIDTKEVIDKSIEEYKKEVERGLYDGIETNISKKENYMTLFTLDLETDEVMHGDSHSFIALKRYKNGEYLVSTSKGQLVKIHEKELYQYSIINIGYNDTDETIPYLITDVVIEPLASINTEKEKEIAEKYKNFILKNSVLGIDNSFEYVVDGENVILFKYTGKSKKVIVPNFITEIGNGAFFTYNNNTNFEYSIELREGLKRIGTYAFARLKIECIEIPKSVEVIRRGAFCRSSLIEGAYGMSDDDNKINFNKVKLLNKNTVVEDLIEE